MLDIINEMFSSEEETLINNLLTKMQELENHKGTNNRAKLKKLILETEIDLLKYKLELFYMNNPKAKKNKMLLLELFTK